MAMIKWIVTTSAVYNALEAGQKESNALYFLEDTREIYKGAQSFTQATELVERLPEKAAQGRIYIDKNTLEGKVWANGTWKTVIEPVAQSLTEETETRGVSGEAVKQYVKQHVTTAIANKVDQIDYNKETKELTYQRGSQVTTVGIEGFVTDVDYNAGVLSFTVQGNEEPIKINLPKDNFVKSGRYDEAKKEIVLELVEGEPVRIPAGDLIDKNEFGNTDTVNMNVSEQGVVTATVKVSGAKDNKIQIKNDGLYVEPTNLDGKLDKVTENQANEIIVSNKDGSVRVSGLKAGGQFLGADPSQNTLATESAVEAIRSSLTDLIGTKINRSAISETISQTSQASHDKVASEKAVAIAIDGLKNEKINKTDISNALTQNTISEEKVVSEKAVVDALSWVTL